MSLRFPQTQTEALLPAMNSLSSERWMSEVPSMAFNPALGTINVTLKDIVFFPLSPDIPPLLGETSVNS